MWLPQLIALCVLPYLLFVAGVRISDADIEEGRSWGYVDCDNSESRDTPSTVTWTLTTDSGQTLDLGTCIAVDNCTSPHSPSIRLGRWSNDSSNAVFSGVNRTLQGLLSCSFTYGGITETDTTPLNFYHKPNVENCSVEISRHNWSAIFSCTITDAFSSVGTYKFHLLYKAMALPSRSTRKFVVIGHSFRDGLTSYVKPTDNQVYYNGTLTYSWHLPAIPYNYTEFRVYAFCSFYSFDFLYLYKNISITPPSQPAHNCSELNYIPEIGVVPCVCTADYLGSPAGRLIWLLGNITVVTGDYGVTKLKFPSGQVSRQHDGMMATCQLDWVQPRITAITRHVAYGPDSVTLQITQSNDSNILLVHVTSHVTNMNPMRAEMVRWGGECEGEQGFTCTMALSAATNVNGKNVTCIVTNTANNGHSATASIVRINGQLTATPNRLTHNCSGLNYIPETGVVPCVCTANYLGSPAGRLVWLLGNITIATGDYGVTKLKFPSGKVSRQHDGMMAACQLDWVHPMTAAMTRHVAYGPDSMTLHVTQYRDTSGNLLIHVTSHVTGMKPINADMVQWGGECQGQHGFTCSLTPRSAAEVDGKAVTCKLTNAANNGHSANNSVLIKISGQQAATPEQPTHNCSGLNYIPENGVVPCVCNADFLGSPVGRLVWLLGNITIATGDYGVTKLKFPSGKVSRQQDGMMATCQLDWVHPMTAAMTKHVAYGPDNMTLFVAQFRDTSSNLLIHVTSNVTGMKPINADMVQWGGECQGQQGFTCTLTPSSAAEVDGKAVTCRVTNAANNGHSADASVLIKISGQQGALHSETKSKPFNWTVVFVGIALSIVVIVPVVLMVVSCRRGSLCRRPEQKQPQTPAGEDPHLYTSLNISGVANSRVNDVQQGVMCPPAVSQGDNRVYDNIPMEGQRGHM